MNQPAWCGKGAGRVLLHDPGGAGRPDCHGQVEVEVEAESVAYLVSAHHGPDTAGYSLATSPAGPAATSRP